MYAIEAKVLSAKHGSPIWMENYLKAIFKQIEYKAKLGETKITYPIDGYITETLSLQDEACLWAYLKNLGYEIRHEKDLDSGCAARDSYTVISW